MNENLSAQKPDLTQSVSPWDLLLLLLLLRLPLWEPNMSKYSLLPWDPG